VAALFYCQRNPKAIASLDNGCALDVIAEILGHDNLDITAHYAQVSTRLMMATYTKTHPHARAFPGEISIP